MNLNLGLLKKHITNGDQSKEGHGVIEIYVFDRICTVCPDYRREC